MYIYINIYIAGVHSMLYIYPMCGIFYLPCIDTGARDHQFRDFADEVPWKILWILRTEINP